MDRHVVQGSKNLEGQYQSDFNSLCSATFVGQLQQSAYWFPELNDIVVSTAHH